MRLSFRRRQLIGAAFVANAVRPVPGYWAGAPSMIAGTMTNELAPLLLAGTAADLGREVVRGGREGRRPRDRVGLAVAAASAAGLAVVVRRSLRTAEVAEQALRDGLGADYRAELAPEHPRAAGRISVIRDLDYHDAEPARRTRLDVHLPARTREGGSPVLLHVHGGAWVSGDKAREGGGLLNHMASRGWLGVNANYRFTQDAPFPAQIEDVKRAIAWIRAHAHEYGGDPAFVAITGGSAGGHLSALAALTANDPDLQPGFEDVDTGIQAAAPRYGIYDFTADSGTDRAIGRRDKFLAPWVMKAPYDGNEAAFAAAAPLRRIGPEAPPFFVVHGTDDTGVEVEEGRYFAARLREVSASPVAYAELPGAQHAFDMVPSIRAAQLNDASGRFLEWTWQRWCETR